MASFGGDDIIQNDEAFQSLLFIIFPQQFNASPIQLNNFLAWLSFFGVFDEWCGYALSWMSLLSNPWEPCSCTYLSEGVLCHILPLLDRSLSDRKPVRLDLVAGE